MKIYTGHLAPLLIGVATRQALSPTARLQAELSRPGSETSCPAAPVGWAAVAAPEAPRQASPAEVAG